MFDSLTNRAEFFSDHYLDARLANDLGDLRSAWERAEGRGQHTARQGLRSLPSAFFAAKANAVEAGKTTRVAAVQALNDSVLAALGFTPERTTITLDRNGGTDELTAQVAAQVETSTGLLLVAIDAGLAEDVDELFNATEPAPGSSTAETTPAGLLLEPLRHDGAKATVRTTADAPGAFFSLDDPPRYVLVVGGATVLLAERSKWAEGRFLAIDVDAALGRGDTKARGELETIAALFSADALVPGHLGAAGTEGDGSAATSVLDQLTESSQKHAVGVSKELRDGMRRSIEVLATEVIDQRLAESRRRHDVRFAGDQVDPKQLTKECLRYLYRLIVLLYAESRPELGVLPTNDDAYLAGYSLDRLRELVLVDLDDDKARNGGHFNESLQLLFDLVNGGYHAQAAVDQMVEQQIVFSADEPPTDAVIGRSVEDYLQFPGLDATIFDPESTPLLDGVVLRNEALQKVLALLMLNKEGKGKHDQRGFISYAQLGINQLGAVYEGLMAYSGFFADQDLYEVAKDGDPIDGTWMLPVVDADEYPDEVFVTAADPLTGAVTRVRHGIGTFVFRLAGRDRQRSASYYTPEVLTQCVVKHSLAELLGTDDYAREPGGSAGITEARQILDLTVCEPALGSGAFANEAINQLSAEYLKRRQTELGETLDAEAYQRELQKVKAHFALHQVYGVDLNETAVELAEVSLWLNCMHPGLKAPWFGLQLRQGNSLIGARRATWRANQLKDKVWARDKNTAATSVVPPLDRPLSEPLDPNEIHHFLLPGHGWGDVAGRKEAKELAPKATESLKAWRKAILASPSPKDAERLQALAAGVERLWVEATEVLTHLHERMHRPLGLYGTDQSGEHPEDNRRRAEAILHSADSAVGRLRLVMDAWVGLWFWPLDTDLDRLVLADDAADAATTQSAGGETNRVQPPTWNQWLAAVEAIIGAEPTEPTGQLDLFADLDALTEIEERRAAGRVPVEQVMTDNPWLQRAESLATGEGAWHWELEFAPVFVSGGFSLQVGNPPWVRLDWQDDLTLAETDPWWGITRKVAESTKSVRRTRQLSEPRVRSKYLAEIASAQGTAALLGSSQMRPLTAGIRTNLYMIFMDSAWRHADAAGTIAFVQPIRHLVDPKASRLRQQSYRRLKRHFLFFNALLLFEEVDFWVDFGIAVYGPTGAANFIQIAGLVHPAQAEGSFDHDGTGSAPGIQLPAGGWDLRPHLDRLVFVTTAVLADWAKMFDDETTPPEEARLLRPVTQNDLTALTVLAAAPDRLADHPYYWTICFDEGKAQKEALIEWRTEIPPSWDEVILQGPHFSVATPFAKQPNEDCKHNQDYSQWDLETLPSDVIPRTNYQRIIDRDVYDSKLPYWLGHRTTDMWRVAWRRMTQPGTERSLQTCLMPRRAAHVDNTPTIVMNDSRSVVVLAGLLSGIPSDYLVKVSGASHVNDSQLRRFPYPRGHRLESALILRTLRLNCLVSGYSSLWEELFETDWAKDAWTRESVGLEVGRIDPTWTMATPLRLESERRLALVEIDAIVALMLGLSSSQLCAMYRTQFAVLRKYEYAMAFDAEGRKICGHHQSAGYRQSQLQERAKAGDLPKEWKSVWKMFEQWEEDPDSIDWAGEFHPPFTRVDREAEMTRAFDEFTRRMAESDSAELTA